VFFVIVVIGWCVGWQRSFKIHAYESLVGRVLTPNQFERYLLFLSDGINDKICKVNVGRLAAGQEPFIQAGGVGGPRLQRVPRHVRRRAAAVECSFFLFPFWFQIGLCKKENKCEGKGFFMVLALQLVGCSLVQLWAANRYGFPELQCKDVGELLEKLLFEYQAEGPCVRKGKLLNLCFFLYWHFMVAPWRNPREICRFKFRAFSFESGLQSGECLVYRPCMTKLGRGREQDAVFLLLDQFPQINMLFIDLSGQRPLLRHSPQLFLKPNESAQFSGQLFVERGVGCMEVSRWPRDCLEETGLRLRVPSFPDLRRIAGLWQAEHGASLEAIRGFFGMEKSEGLSGYLSAAVLERRRAEEAGDLNVLSEEVEGAFGYFCVSEFDSICVWVV